MGSNTKSYKKNNYYLICQNKIFLLLLFLFLIKSSICVEFVLPKAITLINGNILIIHKEAIEVYDSSLSERINKVKTFSDSEQITEKNLLSKVVISRFDQSSDHIIVSLILNKIYIFNYKGEKLYEEEDSKIIKMLNGTYFDLIPLKKSGNKYSYIVA